ncbi:predicted protein [Streptomyces viridosporus ATCC 14672]|uniref:Predicted protein n=1 Tax=Streptomyces viridosporus (strain ATCC 14672 / DSM 40746 / JCM 4963 / KCTC 9882 / NRRL B-12104 / FH 1290) TaxID=566461 RepID=D5ZST0_STRV1|nr:predicted protein [Streptomyces viridosporus ATCC 14672]
MAWRFTSLVRQASNPQGHPESGSDRHRVLAERNSTNAIDLLWLSI